MPPPQWFGGRQKNSWTAEGGLELPLLDRSASADGDGGDESGSASARAEAQVAWQQAQYSAGLVLLSGAFVIQGGDQYWLHHADPDGRFTPHALKIFGRWFVAYAVAQTTGLMLMATSTADANLHMREHRTLAAFVAAVVVVYSVLEAMAFGTGTVALVRGGGGCAHHSYALIRPSVRPLVLPISSPPPARRSSAAPSGLCPSPSCTCSPRPASPKSSMPTPRSTTASRSCCSAASSSTSSPMVCAISSKPTTTTRAFGPCTGYIRAWMIPNTACLPQVGVWADGARQVCVSGTTPASLR